MFTPFRQLFASLHLALVVLFFLSGCEDTSYPIPDEADLLNERLLLEYPYLSEGVPDYPDLKAYMQLPEDSISILVGVALIENEYTRYYGDTGVHIHIHDLQTLADEFKEVIDDTVHNSMMDTLEVFNDVLTDYGYREYRSDEPLCHNYVNNNEGNCVASSITYLSVAEAAGLDFRGVNMPEHLMVRYHGATDSINVETTWYGEAQSNEYLMNNYELDDERIAGAHYYYSLTKKELLGIYMTEIANMMLRGDEQELVGGGFKLMKLSRNYVPSETEVNLMLGCYYDDTEHYEWGLKYYRKCLKSDPKHRVAIQNIAALKAMQYDVPVDLAYDSLMRIYPYDAESWHFQAVTTVMKGDTAYGLILLEYVLGLDEEFVNSLGYMGDIYKARGEYTKAMEMYKQVTEIEPDNEDGWHGLAIAYSNMTGHEREACVALERAMDLDPDIKNTLHCKFEDLSDKVQ